MQGVCCDAGCKPRHELGYDEKAQCQQIVDVVNAEVGEREGEPCLCGHIESEHKALDSRPFGKWNCTYCQCKEYEKL